MAYQNLILVKHSSQLRKVDSAEVRNALSASEREQIITELAVDTAPFAADIDGGYWEQSHGYIRQAAEEIRAHAASKGDVHLHYFGLAEVPHVVALGAYVSDERHVTVHDYHRVNGNWSWSTTEQTLEVGTTPLPQEVVPSGGSIVVRVELSAPITNDDVDAAIGKERLADVTMFPANHLRREPELVRSEADVRAVREKFREVLTAVIKARPNADVIHLFIAAPCSVCFVIGQELRLRNSIDVQTYRYRKGIEGGPYFDALLLTSRELVASAAPPLETDRARIAHIRAGVLPTTLEAVKTYALAKRDDARDGETWYQALHPQGALRAVAPYPTLPSLWEVVGERDHVSEIPRAEGYGFNKDARAWHWSDDLLLGLDRAVGGDEGKLSGLLRLFFFHEYLHDWQSVTKYTADDVGSFANCLERIDYIADLYAILHQLDYVIRTDRARVSNEAAQLAFLAEQIDMALQSFWAFDGPVPQTRWQERRLRRYLNWFWRRVQVLRAGDLQTDALGTALRTLSRQPNVELAGLQYRLGPGRIFVVLDRVRAGENLEIGVVLEDQRFWRAGSAGNMSLEALVKAFIQHDHAQIQLFFNSLFENIRATGGAFAVSATS